MSTAECRGAKKLRQSMESALVFLGEGRDLWQLREPPTFLHKYPCTSVNVSH